MDNFKVSVIVPVYNASEYIGNTLNSIINQDFDGYEIIVIDDGSTDDSLDIINRTLENIEIPYEIIHQENAGVSVARNVGIEASKGDYLVFIDADDHVTPNHISTLYNGESDFSLILYVKEDGDKLIHMDTYSEDMISTEDFIKKELNMEITFNFFQLMYKSSIIKDNNIRFTPGIVYGEDTEFAHKALFHGSQIAINNEVTYYYVQHSESAIKTTEYRRFGVIKIFEDLADFYNKNNKSELANLIITSRIPKAIFGNMNFFFHNGYDFDEVLGKMKELDLLTKLSRYQGDSKFKLKIRLFLLNPRIYYKTWMKLKNSI
ncbi:MAG: glycosyltransferase [Methanobrevibacter thaueri]|jgi:glycosyltransferase involved in cell wall biosynthesis|uniref:glycosyltransferase family 2 protein n=1 Tax=Methanobrevibacter thaueri TaxID=190975 RepID=UPI0026EA859F|nr:glycosyltransferase [Methanobrevibacter thaueri]MBE6495804.1 glycosyltransferase [Methanobrevibacter thaueri]